MLLLAKERDINILQHDTVEQICLDFDFDESKIAEYIKEMETKDKYKGIKAYEWQETKTKK